MTEINISRPSGEIMEELKKLVGRGFKSISLLGQNVNSYGLDKKGDELSFAELLVQIGEQEIESGKDFWVYFTSPHPRDMGEDVLQVMSRYPCLAKQPTGAGRIVCLDHTATKTCDIRPSCTEPSLCF